MGCPERPFVFVATPNRLVFVSACARTYHCVRYTILGEVWRRRVTAPELDSPSNVHRGAARFVADGEVTMGPREGLR